MTRLNKTPHLAAAVALWHLACTGQIGPTGGDGSGSPGAPGAAGSIDPVTGLPTTNGQPAALPPFRAAAAAMRRLTTAQYQNSVRALVGDLGVPLDLEADTAVNGFVEIGAALSTISPAAAEKYQTAAYDIAKAALAADRREAVVGCTPSAVVDSACTHSFVKRFGRRAWRRPLTAGEIDRYAGIADHAAETLSDFHAGLEFAVSGLLQSPNFLFRIDAGEADPDHPDRLRYTSFEMATRLSFLFWNTTPDDVLLDAAEAGDLVTVPGLTAQVARLGKDARVREAMNNFHAERLGMETLDSLAKDVELFPDMTSSLGAAMREDILRTVDYLTFDANADYREIFDTPVTFVNSELAHLYGLPAPGTGFQRMALPEDGLRLGLLGKAGLLAMNAHVKETSPTLRGKFVRERILCESIKPPPANVVPVLPEPDPNAPTMRARLATHATDETCAGCHSKMDPIGLAFENFDAIGAFRSTDDGHELNVTGDLDGTAFDGPRELAAIFREDTKAADCLARQLYRYATGHVENAGEGIVVSDLSSGFQASKYQITQLLQSIVVSDGFRYFARTDP